MKHVHKKTTPQSDSDKEYGISDKLYENPTDGLIGFVGYRLAGRRKWTPYKAFLFNS